MMALLRKALFTWFIYLVFLILLVLRLDEKAVWNWFIIFIPVWIFDFTVIVYVVFHMATHWKIRHDPYEQEWSMIRKIWSLIAILLKFAFQVILCLKLEYFHNLASYYVLIPLWILLVAVSADIFHSLVAKET